jgi:protoheme IX farnesyltransferase
MAETAINTQTSPGRLTNVAQLAKVRLASSVVFSALAGYLLGAERIVWSELLYLGLGGMAVVASANAYNQIIERQLDALMTRTSQRPLPGGRMTVSEALLWATALGVGGLWALWQLNALTAGFGFLSLLLYVLAYTPLKQVTPFAVFVGAIPGAFPALLGWVAATNDFGVEPGLLFALQFIWQFPHFWAIAWVAYDDYAKAGFYLLPTRKRDATSAFQTLVYSLWMIPLSVLPAFGFAGSLTLSTPAAFIIGTLGLALVLPAWQLWRKQEVAQARKLMIFSILYLPLVQLIYVIDAWL